jgi:hypothetical protein
MENALLQYNHLQLFSLDHPQFICWKSGKKSSESVETENRPQTGISIGNQSTGA